MFKESALDEWQAISEFLNDWIKNNGEIQPNNHELWKEFLHRWDNQDWQEIIDAVGELYKRYPEYFQEFHKRAIAQAIVILIEHSSTKRVMDRKKHKRVAWKMIMTLREVWNAAQGIDIPNEDLDPNNFNSLFNQPGE